MDAVPVTDADAEIRQRFFSLVNTLSSLRALSVLDIHRLSTETLLTEALDILMDHQSVEIDRKFQG